MQALLDKGANVSAKAHNGATALGVARTLGLSDVSALLVHAGA